MITAFLPSTNMPVNSRGNKPWADMLIKQEMVDA
jgi:hypothetical protein